MEVFDVAIVGGGPAGSTCAAFCASAGLRTLLLERENFPREKVCGDCINPACWPILERLPRDFGNRIVLQFLPEGYSGQAPVNDSELNLCLVGTPPTISSLRNWAEREFNLSTEQTWRTITPLTRAAVPVAHENLFFIGDAARVVEPFTGEGIYYALRSGELAANAIVRIIRGEDRRPAIREFTHAHRAMYRGRLWINQIARAAVLSPRFASQLLRVRPFSAPVLGSLTKKITKPV